MSSGVQARYRLGASLAGLTIVLSLFSLFSCGDVLSLDPLSTPGEGGAPDAETGSDAEAGADLDSGSPCEDRGVVVCDGFDLPWEDAAPSGWSLHTAGFSPPTLTRSATPVHSKPTAIAAERIVPDGAPPAATARFFVHELASPIPPPFAVEFDLYASEAPEQASMPGVPVVGGTILAANVRSTNSMTMALDLAYQREQNVVRFYPCLSIVGPAANDGVSAGTWLHVDWSVTLTEERLKVTQEGEIVLLQKAPGGRISELDNVALGFQVRDGSGHWLVHYDNARVRRLE